MKINGFLMLKIHKNQPFSLKFEYVIDYTIVFSYYMYIVCIVI